MANVIVTGGSRGLGLGIARALALVGHRVIAIARQSNEQFESVVSDLKSNGSGEVLLRPFDLADTAGIPGLVKSLRAELGPIYGLVNNAGIGTGGVLATMRDSQIEQLLRINLLSPIILSKYVVRSMMASGSGRIVNISSIVSFTGYSGLAVYGASKASLVGFTRSLAREVGPLGITVNAVAPGFIDTDMTGSLEAEDRERIIRRSALRRQATVDDVAHAVEYLLSDKAQNITGTVLTVDAGSTA
jgi:3-oxoacyl-[acyl-carrier protein] reductase